MSSSTATTRGICVSVDARFSPEHSNPERQHWFFLYTIRIENAGDLTVQLQSRHWIITDGDGKVEEVRGEGVVGKQPLIGPGESFRYTSGCPLGTPEGIMVGQYFMVTEKGEAFAVDIPAFSLDSPSSGRRVLH